MRLDVPEHFRHPGELFGAAGALDPREPDALQKDVEIDLRRCLFLRPPAVLWCLVYAHLIVQAQRACTRLVPENMGVCVYLKSLGVFDALKDAGVDVDDRNSPDKALSKLILPLTHFTTESEVEQVTNQALDALQQARLGAPNLHPLVSEVFAELGMNAVQHSESSVGAFGFIQFFEFEQGERFVFGVADGGIGIRRSLARNPVLQAKLYYDWTAIDLAVKERVSGTGDATRGIGLFGVFEDMRVPGRELIIHSGIGSLRLTEDTQREARRTSLFPGTLAYASIRT
jgi:hypothetical protein